MPALQKVSAEQIKAALANNRGNVAATAQELNVSRNSLNERLSRIGVDLAAYRNGHGAGSPLRSTGRKPSPVRVGAAHEAALQDARFDLQYLMRQELTASDVLAMMLDEELAGWIKQKIEALAAKKP